MKKLLIISDSFLPKRDGVVRFIVEVASRLTKLYDVTLLVPDYGGKNAASLKDFNIIKIPLSKPSIVGYNMTKLKSGLVKKLVKENDLVFVQSGFPLSTLGIRYAKKLKKPVAVFVHQLVWEQFANIVTKNRVIHNIMEKLTLFFARLSWNKADLIIVPSLSLVTRLTELGFKGEKKVVMLGCNNDVFLKPADKEEKKKRKGLSNKIVIGYSGRVSPEKNLETLQEAFVELKLEHPEIFLLIVGDGSEKYVERFKAIKDCKITGFVEDVVPYLQAMDIFVMPSLTETTSLSTLEAMSCEIPVIATPVGNIKDYIISGENGFLFPRENTAILKKLILRLVQDGKLRSNIGSKARKTVIESYNWDKTAEGIKESLDRIMKKHYA
ncbi:glycosyltransferase family 4 protein [Nanoarchaeota archaeon]